MILMNQAHAATRYWSGNGTTAGGDGIWDTITPTHWSAAPAGPWNLAWANGNDIAENKSGTAKITLGTNITLGGFTQGAGGSSVSNSIEQGSGPYTLILGNTGANTFSAVANATTGRFLIVNAGIAGGPDNNLVLAGPSTSGFGLITFGRANTFSGNTSFTAGATSGSRLFLKHQFALQNSTLTMSSEGAVTFDSAVSGNAFTLGGLAAADQGPGFDLALQNNNSAYPIALTVGGNSESTTYSGVITGPGSLIKTGGGTLVLDAASNFTGDTTVSGGTLQMDGVTASPTSVNIGAALAGAGRVNAAVILDAGASVIAGDGTTGTLSVASMTFSGIGTINVGALPGYTISPAIDATGALTVLGGTGAVTVNLPTSPGYNGTYHLMKFGSGVANAGSFKTGTVPPLNSNQSGALQVNGNQLDYVIVASGDTAPPIQVSLSPPNNANSVPTDATLVATYNETVIAGSGSIELHRSDDGSLVESFNVNTSPRLTFSAAQITIRPTSDLSTSQQYYIIIPSGAIKDTSGNSFAGITTTTGWRFTVPAVLYTDTGSPPNPPWSQIYPTLNHGSPDNGPVNGSVINVNNPAVEVGLYGNRPFSIPGQRLHVVCNTSTTGLGNFSRWFQTDGNTQVLRLFVNDENTANSRTGTSRTEAFSSEGWKYTDNVTYEWTARYTIAHRRSGYAILQVKNDVNDWALQLNINGNGSLVVNNRFGSDTTVRNPDGTVKIFDGLGFDVRVIDDGKFYKVWIDGVLYSSYSYPRPSGDTKFRWGSYLGSRTLVAPDDFNIILVSGAQMRSWPGNLATPVTYVVKANNSTSLDSGGSWVGGKVPGLYEQPVWNSTVTGANTTNLPSKQQWAGIRIVNPGGPVTINGPQILGIDAAGLDMNFASQNLTINSPVQLTVPNTLAVTSGRTATFSGRISGYPGFTVTGGGTVVLNAANSYEGDTTLSGGTVEANNNSAFGTGSILFRGGSLASNSNSTLANSIDLGSDASVSVATSQTLTLDGPIANSASLTKTGMGTLTLSGSNTNTGPTIVSSGTLAVGSPFSLLGTSRLLLGDGSVLQPRLDGVIINAPITVASSGTTAIISAPTNSPGGGAVSSLSLNSVVSGGGNVVFLSSVNQNALSTVYLGSKSTYTGTTLLNTTASTDGTTTNGESQIIVKLGTENALPITTVLTIDGGNGSGSGRFAELNLNGFDQQLAGLTNIIRSGTKAALRKQRVVNSDVAAPGTLTINNSTQLTFSGQLGSEGAGGSVSALSTPGSTNGNNFGLTKNGGGTFSLTGVLTYAGNTNIAQGTLSCGVINPSNEDSSVTIASTGATLNLAFTGTDTVGKLFIGTTQMGPGVYEAIGNPGSGMEIPQLSGIGTLTVTSGPPVTGYAAWKTVNGTTQTLDLDHDGDGVANGIEYFLGGNTNTSGFTPLPGVTKAAGTLSITWVKAASYNGTYGTDFFVETSPTLAADSWTTEILGGTVVISGNELKYSFPAGTNQFVRLKVTGP